MITVNFRGNMLNKNKQKGVGIFEIVVVMVIIATMYAGIVYLIQRTIDAHNINKLLQNLNRIQLVMMQTFGAKKGYPKIADNLTRGQQLENNLINIKKLVPSDFENPLYNNKLVVMTTGYRGKAHGAFLIRVRGLTPDLCKKVIAAGFPLFGYIQVSLQKNAAIARDVFNIKATGENGIGVIKSMGKQGIQYDPGNVKHINKLCTAHGRKDQPYDIYFGNR